MRFIRPNTNTFPESDLITFLTFKNPQAHFERSIYFSTFPSHHPGILNLEVKLGVAVQWSRCFADADANLTTPTASEHSDVRPLVMDDLFCRTKNNQSLQASLAAEEHV
jgi:hypothetical protein